MQLLLNLHNFTEPTTETLQVYSLQKFSRFKKLFKNRPNLEMNLQISGEYIKSKHQFKLKVIFKIKSKIFVFEFIDKDLRRIIDLAASNIQFQILKHKERLIKH